MWPTACYVVLGVALGFSSFSFCVVCPLGFAGCVYVIVFYVFSG